MITLNDVQSPFSIDIINGQKVISMGDYYVPLVKTISNQSAELAKHLMEFYYKLGFMAAVRQMTKIQE
jgi:hypothetical protein